jgi:predicted RNA-binding protein with PUA-like domain
MGKRYWLMKSEPDVYSIDDLQRDGKDCWEGIRNYQARNFMRDDMKVGDGVLFYHSNAKPPGVAGLARVCRLAYPDHFAWDKKSKYFDPKCDPEDPRWWMVDVEYVETFPHLVSLQQLKDDAQLEDMMVTRRGSRLSIQPVELAHWKRVSALGRKG